jgi:hypothetical protein
MTRLPQALIAVALILAGTAGFLTASAVGQEAPTRTVTIDVATGPQGPPGPAGPPGPKGDPGASGVACIAGFSPAVVVIKHQPGGPTSLYTCVKD